MLEQHNVSFVSVTQDINTSTSAGRMMLNILMTFSEYERLVIGERIRDKVAGAKRRGKYCGGPPPLGYNPNKAKKLVVDEKEAEVVKFIFQRYSELGSAKMVLKELNQKGCKTKAWTTKKGNAHQGGNFNTGCIYRILSNPTYVGQVHHMGNIFQGEHEAIIPVGLWDKVQTLLKINTRSTFKSSTSIPLKGLVRCGYCGGAMTATYVKKKERRYCYFTCAKDTKRAEKTCPLKTVPAGDVENVVLLQLGALFQTPSLLAKTYDEIHKREKAEKLIVQKRLKELNEKQKLVRNRIFKIEHEGGAEREVFELREQFNQLNKEILDSKNISARLNSAPMTETDIVEAFNNIHELWDELFPGEKQRIMYQLIEKVTVLKENIKIELKTANMTSLVSDIINIQTGRPL